MPNHLSTAQYRATKMWPNFSDMVPVNDTLAEDVAALRQEVKALREYLIPASSILISGDRAVTEFNNLAKGLK